MKMRLPDGYRFLRPYVGKLLSDFPDYDQNVFVIMRFLPSGPIAAIHKAMTEALSSKGLKPLRADCKKYHPELWWNICTYMLGCSKAVVVFEDIELREFNPNVALELGFMLALDKPCLILKEKRLPKPPTDVMGRLWNEFDSFAPAKTISEQISRWLFDINWQPLPQALPGPVARFILREASAFHRTLEALKLEFDLEISYNEKAAEVFRQITEKLAFSSPFFRDEPLLRELALDTTEMRQLLRDKERIAELFQKEVVKPLNDGTLSSRARISTAHTGVSKVLDADFRLVKKVESLFASIPSIEAHGDKQKS